MNPRVLLRKIHHWGAIVIAIPLVVAIGAGILLMLKKDVAWIQPPTLKGADLLNVPPTSIAELYAAAAAVPEAGIRGWGDLDRVDVQPGKGTVKFISKSRWEVQVDTATAEVLSAAYRRSDLIESIHDGSFFAAWTKHYLFLPSGIALFVMWVTGLYMFALTRWVNWRRRAKPRRGR